MKHTLLVQKTKGLAYQKEIIKTLNNTMKKKRNQNLKFAESARRKNEIEQYGRLLSLRPSVVHKSKKNYNRQKNKKEASIQMETSFLLLMYFLL